MTIRSSVRLSTKAKRMALVNAMRMCKNRLAGIYGSRRQANEVLADIFGGKVNWRDAPAEQIHAHLWALMARGLA